MMRPWSGGKPDALGDRGGPRGTHDGQATAALGVAYRPDGQGGFDHADVISLLNSKGDIAFQQRGTQAASEELLDKLRALLSPGN